MTGQAFGDPTQSGNDIHIIVAGVVRTKGNELAIGRKSKVRNGVAVDIDRQLSRRRKELQRALRVADRWDLLSLTKTQGTILDALTRGEGATQ